MIHFTLSRIAASLATYLLPYFSGVQFLEDPTQQMSDPPDMFLQVRSAQIGNRVSKRYLWTLRLDLVYELQLNLPDLQREYQKAAEKLDILLETFPYLPSEGDSVMVRTENRNWNIDLNSLHYKFDLNAWVTKEEIANLMKSATLDVEVKERSY